MLVHILPRRNHIYQKMASGNLTGAYGHGGQTYAWLGFHVRAEFDEDLVL
jgi:hypothetical protein